MLQISENAGKLIKKMITRQGIPGGGLRIGVKAGGCSGLSYTFAWEGAARPDDETQPLRVSSSMVRPGSQPPSPRDDQEVTLGQNEMGRGARLLKRLCHDDCDRLVVVLDLGPGQ